MPTGVMQHPSINVKHYNIHPYNMHCVSLSDGKYTLEQRRMGETTTVPSVQGPIHYHGIGRVETLSIVRLVPGCLVAAGHR